MTISVVIPTYNLMSTRGTATLARVLHAVMDQQRPPDEIIVADSSSDGTDEFIAREYPSVTLVHSDERMYAGEARNRGAAEAKGKILAFIDSDCVPASAWLVALAEAYEDASVSAVTGPIRGPEAETLFARIDRIMHLNHLAHLETASTTNHASTSNLSVRTEVFRELGGFPIGLAANEDYAFCTRLVVRYGPITVARGAVVQHVSQDTLNGLLHHQRRFGHGFVDGRRADPTLPGAFAVRHPTLIPTLPVMRAAAIIVRLARHNRQDLSELMAHPVLFARALGAWTRGIREAIAGGQIEWDLPCAPDDPAAKASSPEAGG